MPFAFVKNLRSWWGRWQNMTLSPHIASWSSGVDPERNTDRDGRDSDYGLTCHSNPWCWSFLWPGVTHSRIAAGAWVLGWIWLGRVSRGNSGRRCVPSWPRYVSWWQQWKRMWKHEDELWWENIVSESDFDVVWNFWRRNDRNYQWCNEYDQIRSQRIPACSVLFRCFPVCLWFQCNPHSWEGCRLQKNWLAAYDDEAGNGIHGLTFWWVISSCRWDAATLNDAAYLKKIADATFCMQMSACSEFFSEKITTPLQIPLRIDFVSGCCITLQAFYVFARCRCVATLPMPWLIRPAVSGWPWSQDPYVPWLGTRTGRGRKGWV